LVVLGWLLGLIFQEFHAMFIRSTTLLIALSALASPSLADIHFQTNVLDAYQHQKATQNNTPAGRPAGASYDSGDWWQPTGGWCSNGAWVGAMHRAEYSLGAGNLFSRGNAAEPNWVRQMNYNMEDISIFASRGMPAQPAPLAVNSANAQCISPEDMQSYLTGRGYQSTITKYRWDAGAAAGSRVRQFTTGYGGAPGYIINTDGGAVANPTGGNFNSMFDIYNSLIRNDNLAVIINFKSGSNDRTWWSGSFHQVAGAAVEIIGDQKAIWFADPNDTFRGIGNKNWTTGDWITEDFRYQNGDALPTHDYNFSRWFVGADGRTLSAPGGVSGYADYAGIVIDEIYTMAIPAPGALVLAGLGTLTSLRRRR